jgi:WD40 repeat protein/regulation of enolase protein 1 (concanavalin A-like superfamily)
MKDRREEPQLEIDRGGSVDEIVFSPDGARVAVAQQGQRARMFDLSTRAEVALTGPAAVAHRIEFTPGGKLLGLLGYLPAPGRPPTDTNGSQPILQVWDPAEGRVLAGWKLVGKQAGLLRLAPRGGLVVATCDEHAHVIDRRRELPDKVVPLGGVARALAFAPGGRNVAIALDGGDVLLLDGRTGDVRQRYRPDPEYPLVTAVAFSPDGSQLAVGAGKEGGGGVVRLWRGPRVTLPGWGQISNPDGDCDIRPEDNSLVIRLPPRPHDLSAELGRANAPRLLQDVDGDFSAQVKVCGALHPTAPPSLPGRLAYQAGGLLLWSDDRNYVRLERAALNRDGAILSAAAFEVRVRGELSGARSQPLPDQDAYLRLERRGNQVLGSVSPDGREWTPLEPFAVAFPARVRVGVTAVNTARQSLSVRYEELQIGRGN